MSNTSKTSHLSISVISQSTFTAQITTPVEKHGTFLMVKNVKNGCFGKVIKMIGDEFRQKLVQEPYPAPDRYTSPTSDHVIYVEVDSKEAQNQLRTYLIKQNGIGPVKFCEASIVHEGQYVVVFSFTDHMFFNVNRESLENLMIADFQATAFHYNQNYQQIQVFVKSMSNVQKIMEVFHSGHTCLNDYFCHVEPIKKADFMYTMLDKTKDIDLFGGFSIKLCEEEYENRHSSLHDIDFSFMVGELVKTFFLHYGVVYKVSTGRFEYEFDKRQEILSQNRRSNQHGQLVSEHMTSRWVGHNVRPASSEITIASVDFPELHQVGPETELVETNALPMPIAATEPSTMIQPALPIVEIKTPSYGTLGNRINHLVKLAKELFGDCINFGSATSLLDKLKVMEDLLLEHFEKGDVFVNRVVELEKQLGVVAAIVV